MWKAKSLYQNGAAICLGLMVISLPSSIDAVEIQNNEIMNDIPLNVSLHQNQMIHEQNRQVSSKKIVLLSDPIVSPSVKLMGVQSNKSTAQKNIITSKQKTAETSIKIVSYHAATSESNIHIQPSSSSEKKNTVKKPKQTIAVSKVKTHKTDPNTESKKATTSSRTNVIDIAKSLIGSPYKWGGTSPNGFDCSGFIDYVYGKAGVSLPHSANAIWYGTGVKASFPHPGDLIFFTHTYQTSDSATHVGLYIGGGRFIHAESNGVA